MLGRFQFFCGRLAKSVVTLDILFFFILRRPRESSLNNAKQTNRPKTVWEELAIGALRALFVFDLIEMYDKREAFIYIYIYSACLP